MRKRKTNRPGRAIPGTADEVWDPYLNKYVVTALFRAVRHNSGWFLLRLFGGPAPKYRDVAGPYPTFNAAVAGHAAGDWRGNF